MDVRFQYFTNWTGSACRGRSAFRALDDAGVDRPVVAACEELGRVAGQQEEQEEQERQREEDRRDDQQHPTNDVRGHVTLSFARFGEGRQALPERAHLDCYLVTATCSHRIRPRLVCGKLETVFGL